MWVTVLVCVGGVEMKGRKGGGGVERTGRKGEGDSDP